MVVSIPKGSTQWLAVTKLSLFSKRWFMVKGTRYTDMAVVIAARVVANAVSPKSMCVANIVHLAELVGCCTSVLAPPGAQTRIDNIT